MKQYGAGLVSALALVMAQIASVPALAQVAAQPLPQTIPGYSPPSTRPAPRPQVQPPVTRPVPLPAPVPGRPGGGNGGGNWNGGNNGGNWNGGNNGGNWNGGNNGGNWNGGNQGGNWNGSTVRCESRGYRYAECRADTRGGVRLARVLGGDCQRNNWGYQPNFIWVNHGCRADFQTRYGNNNGGGNYDSGGPSAGAVIGGVAVAAGLIALLASSSKKETAPTGTAAPPLPQQPPIAQQPYVPPTGSSGAPARITANTGGVTPSARPSLNTCLTVAARQIGATGGTEIRLDRLDDIEQGNGGYRFRFQLIAVYPDETRTIPTFCRATPTTLVELTFG